MYIYESIKNSRQRSNNQTRDDRNLELRSGQDWGRTKGKNGKLHVSVATGIVLSTRSFRFECEHGIAQGPLGAKRRQTQHSVTTWLNRM